MPPTQPATSAPFPVPPAPVMPPVVLPAVPPPHFGYTPGGWGHVPNHYPAPAQPYPIGYPLGLWPPYQQYYAGPPGHGDEDSETTKPDKFTGQEPSKLCPFIVSCVMAFDSRPCKFATDCQQVSYAASYLSDIAILWWQPILVAFPEPSICNDWGEFFDQLNTYFGKPNLAQASEHALRTLMMYNHQHVNKYMIEFSEHVTHTGWNDVALYGEFYRGLAGHIKDQFLSLDHPQMFQQLKVNLK